MRYLARNVLLFTLLLDDIKGLNHSAIWNAYYHIFLDAKSLELAHLQSKKLHVLATSIQTWHGGEYGKLLRFCDNETLNKIREIWGGYSVLDLSEDEMKSYNKRFKSDLERSLSMRKDLREMGLNLTVLRSAAPAPPFALDNVTDLYRYYRDHGVTDHDPAKLSKASYPNPMFASVVTDSDPMMLHYGTDPLLGFHLATAYVPLSPGSPFCPQSPKTSHLHKAVEAARLQFRTWSISFCKRAQQNLVIRFCTADALAFCNTLEYKLTTKEAISANMYRGPYGFEPLVLDGVDYASDGKAPFSFDVIDSSNIIDHIGAINVLVATSPLLKNSFSATLYTESLLKREENHKASMSKLLCGHLPTISTLLKLFPMEYWTNATAVSTSHEGLLDTSLATTQGSGDNGSRQLQLHNRLIWKRPISVANGQTSITTRQEVHFDEQDLAHILYQVYQEMFQHENLTRLFSKIDVQTISKSSLPCYHRGSLVAFLRLVKRTAVVNWAKMMEKFLDLFENDSSLMMGSNYFQEFYLQLHIHGVYSVPTLEPSYNRLTKLQPSGGLRAWKDIPEVLCITLKVPRSKLGVITKLPVSQVGTPILHCVLRSSPTFSPQAQNIFAILQLSFGEITTSGPRNTDAFKVHVAEDRRGWAGSSPLIASFYVPTWFLLLEPEKGLIILGIQTTPQSFMTFHKALGPEMSIYKTTLGNRDDVYITKHPPNQSNYPSVPRIAPADTKIIDTLNNSSCATVTAQVDRKNAQMLGFTGRIDFLSGATKSILGNEAAVKTLQISPCTVDVVVGSGFSNSYRLYFPAPVLHSRRKTRIARKSSYVEVVVPIATLSRGEGFPHFMYPLFLEDHIPVVWNMPHLDLQCLPAIDMTKTKELEWLVTHTSFQFSSRERVSRESSSGNDPNDVRLNFKDSLFSIFMYFTGLQGSGTKRKIFGIDHPTRGVHIMVFVSSLRLDLANHTVVLDAAVLPLSDRLVPQIRPFLAAISGLGLCMIKVNDDEFKLWKEMLPAWVERCREWKHKSSCEYKRKDAIPLSVEEGQTPLCSCGNGILPPNFISDVPQWDMASKHAVRAAISPSFSVPYVEDVFDFKKSKETLMAANRCRKCGREKSEGGGSLLRCSRCLVTKYCSTECQRAHWQEHKKVCKK
jgi:hypothetical protein